MKGLIGIITDNLTTKLMALFMAVALWTYAYFSSIQEISQPIPVVINAPRGWAVIERSPAVIEVTLQYPKYSAEQMKDALARNLVLAEYTVPTAPEKLLQSFTSVPLSPGNFRLPSGSGARILSWKPDDVSFTIAKEGTKRLDVRLKLSDPPKGYAIQGEPWYNPRSVMVRGPEEALSKVNFIYTDEISVAPPRRVGPAPRSAIGLQHYIEANEDGKMVKFDVSCSDQIEYTVYLTEMSESKVFEKVPVLIMQPPGYANSVKLKQQEMRVTVRGPEKELAALKPENVLLSVDVTSLAPGPTPYPQPVHCQLVGVADPELMKVELEQQTVGVDVGPATAP